MKRGKLNVRIAMSFATLFFTGIVVLLMLGHDPLDIFAAIVFIAFLISIGCAIDVLGLGKYFGGD